MMRVEVESDMCIGSGMCSLLAGEVFGESADEGIVVLLDEHPPPHLHAAVREAVTRCPSAVIRVYENG